MKTEKTLKMLKMLHTLQAQAKRAQKLQKMEKKNRPGMPEPCGSRAPLTLTLTSTLNGHARVMKMCHRVDASGIHTSLFFSLRTRPGTGKYLTGRARESRD